MLLSVLTIYVCFNSFYFFKVLYLLFFPTLYWVDFFALCYQCVLQVLTPRMGQIFPWQKQSGQDLLQKSITFQGLLKTTTKIQDSTNHGYFRRTGKHKNPTSKIHLISNENIQTLCDKGWLCRSKVCCHFAFFTPLKYYSSSFWISQTLTLIMKMKRPLETKNRPLDCLFK